MANSNIAQANPGSFFLSVGWLIPQILAIIAIFLPIFNGSPEKSLIFIMLTGCLMTMARLSSWQSEKVSHQNGLICNMFYLFDTISPDCPSKNTLFVSFTCIYLLSPMILYDTYNYWAILLLMVFLGVHVLYQYKSNCSTAICYVSSLFWGAFIGYLSVFFIARNGLEYLLYFNELANNKVVCNKTTSSWNTCRTG